LGFTYHPEADDRNHDGEESFEDEDPGPARLSTDTVHVHDSSGQQATKGSGESCGTEEDGCSDTEFGSFVPTTQVVVDT
jgi:hypothetical protein